MDRGRGGAAEPIAAAGEARASAASLLQAAIREGTPPFDAVRRTAQATGLRRNEVYRLWLSLKEDAAGAAT